MIPAAISQIVDELAASRRRLEERDLGTQATRRMSALLGRLGQRITRPPRIVLMGEFNAGKTTLANALIGADVLPTSIHANTRIPIHVLYSAVPSLVLELPDHTRRPLTEALVPLLAQGGARMLHVGLPVKRLQSFELIDTPGLASGMTRLEQANTEACRHANIAIWCTAATQAWKATESAAWSGVPARLQRKGLLVVTLADMIYADRDRGRIEARLRSETGARFADLVMVNAADIDELRRNGDIPDRDERWDACGGRALDDGIGRLVDLVWSERQLSLSRVLQRAAARGVSAAGADRSQAA